MKNLFLILAVLFFVLSIFCVSGYYYNSERGRVERLSKGLVVCELFVKPHLTGYWGRALTPNEIKSLYEGEAVR